MKHKEFLEFGEIFILPGVSLAFYVIMFCFLAECILFVWEGHSQIGYLKIFLSCILGYYCFILFVYLLCRWFGVTLTKYIHPRFSSNRTPHSKKNENEIFTYLNLNMFQRIPCLWEGSNVEVETEESQRCNPSLPRRILEDKKGESKNIEEGNQKKSPIVQKLLEHDKRAELVNRRYFEFENKHKEMLQDRKMVLEILPPFVQCTGPTTRFNRDGKNEMKKTRKGKNDDGDKKQDIINSEQPALTGLCACDDRKKRNVKNPKGINSLECMTGKEDPNRRIGIHGNQVTDKNSLTDDALVSDEESMKVNCSVAVIKKSSSIFKFCSVDSPCEFCRLKLARKQPVDSKSSGEIEYSDSFYEKYEEIFQDTAFNCLNHIQTWDPEYKDCCGRPRVFPSPKRLKESFPNRRLRVAYPNHMHVEME